MKTHSWVLTEPEKLEWTEFEVPSVEEDGLLLKVTMVSVCGSDPHYYRGKNRKDLPMILGHEMVGIVDEIGAKAEEMYGVKKGDRITVEPYMNCGTCRYCRAGYYQLCEHSYIYGCKKSCRDDKNLWGAYGYYMYVGPGSHVYKVGDGIPDEAAVFSSVIGNGYRMIKTKGQVKESDTVVIFGPGALGLSAVIAAREQSAKQIIAIGLSKDQKRLELAKEYGAAAVVMTDKEDPVDAVSKLTGGEMADVVVECTGASVIYNQAIAVTRKTGTLVLLGLNSKSNPVNTDEIIEKELTVKGCSGQPNNCQDAMRTINSGRFAIEKMATHKFPVRDADKALAFAMQPSEELIRVVMDCSGNEE